MGQQLSGSVTKSSSSTSQAAPAQKSASEKEFGTPRKDPIVQRSSSQPLNPPARSPAKEPAKKKDPKESLYENLSYKDT